MKVATYNIRYQNSKDSLASNVWEVRSASIFDMLRYEEPDIFGCQEDLAHSVAGAVSHRRRSCLIPLPVRFLAVSGPASFRCRSVFFVRTATRILF